MLGGYLDKTDCGAKRAGVVRLFIAEVADVESFTLNPSGSDWSAVTMNTTTSAVFKKYDFVKGEAELKMDIVVENGSSKATNSIAFNFKKLSQTSRDAVQELSEKSNCGLIAIAETNQGDKWVIGYDSQFEAEYYAELQSGNGTSGKALTDVQGFTNTIGNETVELPRVLTAAVPV